MSVAGELIFFLMRSLSLIICIRCFSIPVIDLELCQIHNLLPSVVAMLYNSQCSHPLSHRCLLNVNLAWCLFFIGRKWLFNFPLQSSQIFSALILSFTWVISANVFFFFKVIEPFFSCLPNFEVVIWNFKWFNFQCFLTLIAIVALALCLWARLFFLLL